MRSALCPWVVGALALSILLSRSVGTAGIVEDFDGGWADRSYAGVSTYNHAGVGIWVSNDALVSRVNARSGEGVRFDDGTTSPYLEFQGLDGNGIDGGVGTVSFWYRHWDGDGSTVSFALEYSIGGGSWIEAGTGTVTTETAYQKFASVLNLTDNDIRLRIVGTVNNERLLLDDVEVTSMGPTMGFLHTASMRAEPDGTISIPVQLSLLDDTNQEPNESLILILSGATGAGIERATHVLTITDDDATGAPGAGELTIMTANTTSGNTQDYEGPGDRIFQALDPDVVAIQEFNVPDAGGRRAWVDRVFGTGFHYMVEPGEENIPCGVVSRYPITASGQWEDPQVGDRDFAWATIDIPGAIDLHVISVHLHGSGGTASRDIEAGIIMTAVGGQFPASDYIALCGDFNTTLRTEAAVQTFKAVFSDQHVPVDRHGDSDTNEPRNKPYDWVMPNGPLEELHQAITVGGLEFPDGLVFDSRLWSPPPAPALAGDSGAAHMQHMAVIKSYLLPLTTTMGTPVSWFESYGITSEFDNAELLDLDGDGLAAWQEYVAGTDPTVAASVFEIVTVEGENSVSVTCSKQPIRHYETRPFGGWHTFVDDFGPETSGGSAPGGWRLYRVGVSPP